MTSKLVVNTIEADTGISSVSFASSISMNSTAKFHFSAAGIDIGADTNINRPEAGVLGFNISSSEKLRINSNGKVGLGTTGSEYGLSIREADNNNKWLMLQKNSGQELLQIREDGDNHVIIDGSHASGELHFYTAGSERLRITSAGNVTVGGHTAALSTYNSSQPRLSVYKSSGSGGYLELGGNIPHNGHSSGTILFINNDNSDATNNNANGKILAMQRVENSTSDTNAGDDMGGDLVFMTKPESGSLAERLRIDSNGMIGFGGVTPKTQNTFDAIEFGLGGFLGSQTGARTVEIASNAYYNSGWKYKENDVASQYYQYQGYHAFGTASSGSADGAVTFNEVFKINADGKAQFAGAADVWLTLGNQGTAGSNSANWIRGYNSDLMFNAASNQYRFEIAGTERMNLRSDGNLYLRSASANYVVLGSNGSATSSGISNNMNWIRGNGANTQYNTSGGFHAFEVSGVERFKIDNNGYVHQPAMPFGVLHGTTGWQYNNNGNGHYLLGNTTSSSGGGNGSDKQMNLGWTASSAGATNNNFTPSNGIWTAPVAGYYTFSIKLYCLMNNNEYIQIKPSINGSHVSECIYGYQQGNGTYCEGINETVNYYLAANDTFSWNAYGPNNSWRIYGAHSELSGYLVRGA